ACLQFSSPAWRMASRDAWVGWDDAGRTRNLQLVVNNSRFLILPWVRAQNLASTIDRRQLLWPVGDNYSGRS
ncbi:MAG TPA: Druantia anti-phage system protein DruA, partial [Methylomirabilota bacterium]|nr:Druantia anti-phage system protein DruA [Methylomirabilota bacterium]